MIRNAFNAGQYEIAQKGVPLEIVNAWHYPPQYTYCYLHEFEREYAEGDRYQAGVLWQANNMVICYSWEPSYWIDDATGSDEGYRLMLPWECGYATPNDLIPITLHQQMLKPIFAAYDQEAILPTSQAEVSSRDSDYRTRTGTVQSYYRDDSYHNHVILYPRPSSVTFQELDEGDVYDDTGGIISWIESSLDYADTGIITDTVASDDALVCAFEILPTEVDSDTGTWDDDLDWPDYMVKYVEYAALERLFGADNDGFIPSLRDYWAYRKNVGIEALKRYRRMRMADRTFVMGHVPTRGKPRLRLPDHYPAV